jgi:hypothetical protein
LCDDAISQMFETQFTQLPYPTRNEFRTLSLGGLVPGTAWVQHCTAEHCLVFAVEPVLPLIAIHCVMDPSFRELFAGGSSNLVLKLCSRLRNSQKTCFVLLLCHWAKAMSKLPVGTVRSSIIIIIGFVLKNIHTRRLCSRTQ